MIIFSRYWVLGTLVLPVILYYWYLWLDARFVGQAAVTIIKKMLLDQFLISPPILVTFYTLMSVMEGREDVTKELRWKRTTYMSVPASDSDCLTLGHSLLDRRETSQLKLVCLCQ